MLPYDGVLDEAEPVPQPSRADKVSSSSSTSTATAQPRPSTSAWQWDAQWGLYFNSETKQWAKPMPDGSWEYADAVRTEDGPPPPSPRRKKKQRLDRDDPEQADENYDPFAVPEEQIWPGGDTDDDGDEAAFDDTNRPDPYANAPLLRLVVSDPQPEPSVLPTAQQVASIDPGEPVSIGRDKSYERRIRLRELAVSKAHATIFWTTDPQIEEKGGYWAIVDNASTHGTFVRADGEKRFVRLSEAKVASVPHRLYHLDSIRVGSTTFAVHIHPSFACSVCSVASDSSNLIPLVTTGSSKDNSDSQVFLTKTKEQKEQDRREQMAGLKAQFLKPPVKGGASPRSRDAPNAANGRESSALAPASVAQSAPPAKATFVDRAAARRQRDIGASIPLPAHRKQPASSSVASASPFFTVPGATASATAAAASSAAPSKPADPFASDSRGAQLLSKLAGGRTNGSQSGQGGVSGGSSQLGTLIEARTTMGGPGERRAGLGSKELVVGVENVAASYQSGRASHAGANGGRRDWRDAGRERSWKRFREV
ncbi:hypothetical protein JCM3774_001208 [Rhodotorula dairenensis]